MEELTGHKPAGLAWSRPRPAESPQARTSGLWNAEAPGDRPGVLLLFGQAPPPK